MKTYTITQNINQGIRFAPANEILIATVKAKSKKHAEYCMNEVSMSGANWDEFDNFEMIELKGMISSIPCKAELEAKNI